MRGIRFWRDAANLRLLVRGEQIVLTLCTPFG